MWTSEIQQVPLPTQTIPVIAESSTAITPAIRFIRLPEVKQLTSLCRSAILAIDGFPKAVRLGPTRARAWIEFEVIGWMEQQIAARSADRGGR